MYDMPRDEWRAFLLEGTRTAKLSTVRADGRPHVTPVWFVLEDDDTIVFTTHTTSLKAQALRRDPRVSLCVDDETAPFAYVMVDGTADLSSAPADLLRFATAIGGRYMGPDRAEEFGRRNAVDTEVLVRVRPSHVVAHARMTD
jgi:PPOX class probable F420-dependent enzyme